MIEDGFPAPGAMDVALSHAILSAVADGDMNAAFRLHTPGAVVAFGRSDRVEAGYPEAVRAASASGFSPVERLAGGRAAVFHRVRQVLGPVHRALSKRFHLERGTVPRSLVDRANDLIDDHLPRVA